MTIDEAIQEFEDCKGEQYIKDPDVFGDALQLGIEALKHCRDIHHMSYEDLHILLPGETKCRY